MKYRYLMFVIFYLIMQNNYANEIIQKENDFDSYTDTIFEDSNKKAFLTAGTAFSHFIPTSEAEQLDMKTPFLSPGGELMIGYQFLNKVSLITGLYYQYGKIELDHSYYGDRIIFQEASAPILVRVPLLKNQGNKCILTTGLYLGEYFNIKRETKGGKLSSDTNEWVDHHVENSSGFISDVYLSFGSNFFNQFPVNCELFAKYRLTEQWINNYVSKFYYGIKINYQFTL